MDTLEKAEFTASISNIAIIVTFKIRNNDFQFRSPKHSWQKTKKKKNTTTEKCFAFHTNAKTVTDKLDINL